MGDCHRTRWSASQWTARMPVEYATRNDRVRQGASQRHDPPQIVATTRSSFFVLRCAHPHLTRRTHWSRRGHSLRLSLPVSLANDDGWKLALGCPKRRKGIKTTFVHTRMESASACSRFPWCSLRPSFETWDESPFLVASAITRATRPRKLRVCLGGEEQRREARGRNKGSQGFDVRIMVRAGRDIAAHRRSITPQRPFSRRGSA